MVVLKNDPRFGCRIYLNKNRYLIEDTNHTPYKYTQKVEFNKYKGRYYEEVGFSISSDGFQIK